MAKGTSRLIEIPVRDEAGNPFDMTGGRAVFWVGESICRTEGVVVIEKNSPTVSETAGLWSVIVPILPVDTETLPSRSSYYYECRVWDLSDNEYVVAADRFEITPSITVDAPTP